MQVKCDEGKQNWLAVTVTLLENHKLCPKIQFSEKFKISEFEFHKKQEFLRIFKWQIYLGRKFKF